MLAAAKRLPSSPRVVSALEAALHHPDVDIDSVVSIVRVDPGLAVKVIRVSNSPIFRRGSPVETLDMAIGRIGLREIHRLVGAAVADQLFAVGLPLYRILGDDLWMNAVVTALSAEQFAIAAGRPPREAYTLGLLRSAGRMLLQRIGQEAGLLPPAEMTLSGAETRAWEEETFGMSADEASARLLELWEFSPAVVNGLRYAWSPLDAPDSRPEPALLHLGCWGAEALGKGLAIERGNWTASEEVLGTIGLTVDHADSTLRPTRQAVNRTLQMMKPDERV